MNETVNDSEQFVYEICKRSFLSKFSYNNPQGKTPGKELCDILVVCDPHVIAISVKDVNIPGKRDIEVEHNRWIRKAVDSSIEQLSGAMRILETAEYVTAQDGSIGLSLPRFNLENYHAIAVAIGGHREIPLKTSKTKNGVFVHVLDEDSFFLLMRFLDTITDFTKYLIDKEKFLMQSRLVIDGGEENLMAYYLHNGRVFHEQADFMIIGSDLWEGFSEKEEFAAKVERDKVSYTWDKMIEVAVDGKIVFEEYFGPKVNLTELVARTMAKEDRFQRRMLGEGLLGFLEGSNQIRSRILQSTSCVGYVFCYYDRDSKLEDRRAEITARCYAAILSLPHANTVVGISMNKAGDIHENGYSTDLVYLTNSGQGWTDKDLEIAQKCRDDLGFFQDPDIIEKHEDEYPQS